MKVYHACHPAVKFLNEVIERDKLSKSHIADIAGVDRRQIQRWIGGIRSPNLGHIEAVFNAVGYTLVAVPK